MKRSQQNPGMQAPPLVRVLWLGTGLLLLVLANANLAYLMTQSATPTLTSVARLQEVITPPVTEVEGGAAALCSLSSVQCENEGDILVVPVRIESIAGFPVARDKGPVKIGASKAMQEMVDYAWAISKDRDFILTIEAESGFNPAARNVNRNGTVDSGIAQINHYYHPKIVNDPRFKDWRWQLEQGWKLYSGGTRFFGHDVRHRVANRFSMK